jgi:hypothetical protein
VKLTFIDLFGHRIWLAEDRCTNEMRSRIGLFEKTCLCRSGQPPEELNLRTLIDECFFVERVSQNLEEIGNLVLGTASARRLATAPSSSVTARVGMLFIARGGCRGQRRVRYLGHDRDLHPVLPSIALTNNNPRPMRQGRHRSSASL